MHNSVVILLLAACTCVIASQQCSNGDVSCFCETVVGGTYKEMTPPLLSSCQLNYVYQGIPREAHVYLPPTFDGMTSYPVWMHLHGVFWTTMGDIAKKVGHPVNGTDIIPVWDRTIELFGDKAIFVYPQSLGDPGTGDEAVDGQGDKYRQFWHIPFWRCSVGICRPEDLDDVGFIEKVMADLPARLPMTPGKYYLSGESAGGMMVETLLCQSNTIGDTITAAVDILGGIGADYALGSSCARSNSVPYLHLHGIEDPSITYDKRVLVDGVNFLSAIENTKLRAQEHGCLPTDAGPETLEADGNLKCTDFCAKAEGKPPAEICGIVGAAHDTNHPYAGFVYEQAWKFFEQQAQQKASTVTAPPCSAAAEQANNTAALPQPATSNKTAGAPNPSSPPLSLLASPSPSVMRPTKQLPSSPPVHGPLILVVIFPGTSVSQFKVKYSSKALDSVSSATGLPTKNITVTYKPSGNSTTNSSSSSGASKALYASGKSAKSDNRQHRRHLAQLSSTSSSSGVVASFTLSATQPAAVAAAVKKSVEDGSFLAQLQDSGLITASDAQDSPDQPDSSPDRPSQGPIVSLHAAGSRLGSQARQPEVLLPPTNLLDVAQERSTGDDGLPGQSSSSGSRSAQVPGLSDAGGSSSSNSSNVGVIVGGVIGGVLGGAVLVGAIWWAAAAARRRRHQPDATVPGAPHVAFGGVQSSDAVMHVVEDGGTGKLPASSDLR